MLTVQAVPACRPAPGGVCHASTSPVGFFAAMNDISDAPLQLAPGDRPVFPRPANGAEEKNAQHGEAGLSGDSLLATR